MKRLRQRLAMAGTAMGVIALLLMRPAALGLGLWLLDPNWQSWTTYAGVILLWLAAS